MLHSVDSSMHPCTGAAAILSPCQKHRDFSISVPSPVQSYFCTSDRRRISALENFRPCSPSSQRRGCRCSSSVLVQPAQINVSSPCREAAPANLAGLGWNQGGFRGPRGLTSKSLLVPLGPSGEPGAGQQGSEVPPAIQGVRGPRGQGSGGHRQEPAGSTEAILSSSTAGGTKHVRVGAGGEVTLLLSPPLHPPPPPLSQNR